MMNGAHYADLKIMDSLAPLESVTGGKMKGLPHNPGFYPSGLTLILTNPPFGSKVTDKRVLEDFANRDGASKANGKVSKTLPQEIAFLNRCLEYLAPGGRMGIVLPDGVLANSSMQYIRDWVLRWARLKAVVSLPQETFAPYGAGVKTSVLFLEKRAQPLREGAATESWVRYECTFDPQGKVSIKTAVDEHVSTNYPVYMAHVKSIGYDASGRLSVSEDEAHMPPKVKDTIADFNTKVGWKNASWLITNEKFTNQRWDYGYHAFHRMDLFAQWEKHYASTRLGEIIQDDSYGILTPGTVYSPDHPITFLRATDMRSHLRLDFSEALKFRWSITNIKGRDLKKMTYYLLSKEHQ